MKRAIKILLILLAGALLLSLLPALVYLGVTSGERLDPQRLTLASPCVRVFDADGNLLETERTGGVNLEALPSYLPNAFVAVEDKRFYAHGGLDYRRIAKAALKNLTSFSFREGASTISQQLIKNTHLSGEKTISRKLKEIKLTLELEEKYSKEEILELYLNSIYFGHSAFGLSAAAEYYFAKPPEALTPAESATLAALVRSPNRYSPFKDPEKCLARRNFVLSLMEEQGYISESNLKEAKEEPLPKTPHEPERKSAYLSLVFGELAALFPDANSSDALDVYTYLDPALQALLEETEEESDLCLLVRDNKTNALKAYHSTCGELKRLPASTIKPLAVYAPALEENLISPATPILDEKTDFGGYSPSNYGGAYGGYMSARYALSRSVNVPAVKLLNSLGVERAAEYLGRIGLPVPEEDRTLALALGGMKEGYTLPALADGYAVLANGGVYTPSATVSRVLIRGGKLLYERKTPTPSRVFSEDVCALVGDMLQTAAKEGTAKRLSSLPFEVRAKTGTGGTESGNTDAYTIAYTTKDVVAVRLGNRDNSPVNATGGGAPASIAARILARLGKTDPPPPFPSCEGVEKVALDREAYEKQHRLLLADPLAPEGLTLCELFRKSAIPTETCDAFSRPKIEKPLILVKNGAVEIILCQTYYYDYVVKRECEGEISVVYSGKYRRELFDNSVRGGKTYTYTVTPSYCGIEGETVTLPSVFIGGENKIPDDWWREEATTRRSPAW